MVERPVRLRDAPQGALTLLDSVRQISSSLDRDEILARARAGLADLVAELSPGTHASIELGLEPGLESASTSATGTTVVAIPGPGPSPDAAALGRLILTGPTTPPRWMLEALAAQLGASLDLSARERAEQNQQLDAIAQLAAGITHDLNNMLTGILTSAEMLDLDLPPTRDEGVNDSLRTLIAAAQQAAGLTRKLMVSSRPGHHASGPVRVHESIEAKPADPSSTKAPEAPTIPVGATILLVDDEFTIRTAGARMLEDLGYRVLLAADGKAAVERFERDHAEIDVVLLDMIMPVMDGREAFIAMQAIDPRIPIIVCSGYASEAAICELEERGLAGFMAKPYRRRGLVAEIERCLAGALPR